MVFYFSFSLFFAYQILYLSNIDLRDLATMKFGHNLSRNVVPEWGSSYIKYKALKKLIKSVAQAMNLGHEVDLAGKSYPFGP